MAKISNGPRASANATAVPTKGAEQGVASRVANTPVPNWPAERGVAADARQPPDEGRHRDFEPAPEIGREQRQQEHHRDEEPGLLELNAPADRAAHALQRHQGRRRGHEGDKDAGRRGEESEPHMAAVFAVMADKAEQLQRQHRQHAGHDVQDESAEQRHQQHRDDRRRRQGRRRGR